MMQSLPIPGLLARQFVLRMIEETFEEALLLRCSADHALFLPLLLLLSSMPSDIQFLKGLEVCILINLLRRQEVRLRIAITPAVPLVTVTRS